jgi:hypothetical protein
MLLPTARGEPPIGRAYYTPEPALPAEARETLADLRAVVGMLAPAGVEQAADA